MSSKIRVRLEVDYPKSLLLSIISKRIPLYDILVENKQLIILIHYHDLEKIEKIKSIKKIQIIQEYGLLGFYFYLKKNIFLILCVFLGVALNIFLSKIVFSIDVSSSNKELVKQVNHDLNTLGFTTFIFQPSYDEIQKIKEKLIMMEKDSIEWLEIEKKGVKYTIKIEEKKLNKKESTCIFRNVIAKKKAILTRVDGVEGEIIHRKGEYVSSGDIVIGGEIHNGEEVVSKKCADGKIYGEVWYLVFLSFPLKGEIIKKTNHRMIGIYGNYREYHFITNPYPIYLSKKYSLLKSNVFPFDIGFTKIIKKEKYMVDYTVHNIDSIIYESGTKELERRLSSNVNVLRKNILKKEIKNSKIRIEVFFSIEEDITDYQIIEE